MSNLRSLTLLETGLFPNAHNEYSQEVINRTRADIGSKIR